MTDPNPDPFWAATGRHPEKEEQVGESGASDVTWSEGLSTPVAVRGGKESASYIMQRFRTIHIQCMQYLFASHNLLQVSYTD